MLMCFNNESGFIYFISCLPIFIDPLFISQNLAIRLVTVVLPEPEGPTKAVIVPSFALKLKLSIVFSPSSYSKLTFSNSIS